LARLPDRLVDLLEVASYIYAADSAISRGGRADSEMGARWRRNFRFRIPVRQPDLWASHAVTSALVDTLGFLSDDQYAFEFLPLKHAPSMAGYLDLELAGSQNAGFSPDEVILFSGGLDSFAGAVQELIGHGKKVALVSHRSAGKIAEAQTALLNELRNCIGSGRMLHIPVWVRLDGELGNEQTHRTRSFLFATLGAVTARLFQLNRISFYENGIVSLNLPPVAQVVGARATRTTHPQALTGFRRILSAILDHPMEVTNPFIWRTKAELIQLISSWDCGHLIRHTRSCTRVREMTILHPHCGQCSQCIDRRFAVLAAQQEHHDPEEAYKVELFTGERLAGPDREMALSYVRTASEINHMEDVAFFERFGEASRALRYFPESADTVAGHILDLHRRHAAGVCSVFDQALRLRAPDLRQGTLPSTSLLPLVVSQRDLTARHPQATQVAHHPVERESGVRLAIGEDGDSIIFNRWGKLTGVGARLVLALVKPFSKAVAAQLAPERYPFVKTRDLLRHLGTDNEETLRNQIFRFRRKIQQLARKAGDPTPADDAVIESIQSHGYRLNPDTVRILALNELRSGT
jgi:hypothetical protein